MNPTYKPGELHHIEGHIWDGVGPNCNILGDCPKGSTVMLLEISQKTHEGFAIEGKILYKDIVGWVFLNRLTPIPREEYENR